MKYPCLYPTEDGRRCLECDACQNPDYVPEARQSMTALYDLTRWVVRLMARAQGWLLAHGAVAYMDRKEKE